MKYASKYKKKRRIKAKAFLAPALLAVLIVACIILYALEQSSGAGAQYPSGDTATGLVFSEICTKNDTIIADNDGSYRDYVEIYNGGGDTNLQGCFLTDGNSASKPLGDIPLVSGAYYVLFLDKELTGFSLSATGGDPVQLKAPGGKIITQANTVPLGPDQVMLYDGTGYTVSDQATPGFSNDAQGLQAFREGVENKNPTLLISEVLSENASSLPDAYGQFRDAVELYNSGNEPVYLGEYFLSDSLEMRFRYRLPNIMVEAGEYVVIFCDGRNEVTQSGEIHANFGLSSRDKLCLTGKDGSYTFLSIQFPGEDISMSLNAEGGYQASSVSLGYPNDEAGVSAFAASREDATAALVISEVLLSSAKVPYQGSFCDVVEITNRSAETVSTAGWYLSDGGDPTHFELPHMELAPGECLVVNCSRETTGFALSQRDTLRLLTPEQKWASQVLCANAEDGKSLVWLDTAYAPGAVSVGYPNTGDGAGAYEQERLPSGLIISELMSANSSLLKGPYGDTCDWVELYNSSNETIQLSQYSLSDDSNESGKYPLPDKALAPGQHYVILLSTKPEAVRRGYEYLPMNISSQGDFLYLSNAQNIVDYVAIPALGTDNAYGRAPSAGSFTVLSSATPGSGNASAVALSAMPRAVTPQGVYENVSAVTVELSGKGTIYYTTDSTKPTRSSAKYTTPLQISETTVIRAICCEDGKQPSAVLDLTYLVNENDRLPAISMVTDPDNLWDYYTGIYVDGPGGGGVFPYKGSNYWQPWERQATVSLFEKDGTGFSAPCGISIFGQYSRAEKMKSFACAFRDVYGMGSLDYRVFGDEGLGSYEALIFRCSGQDVRQARMRDTLVTSLVADYTDVPVQKYRPAVLYINGEFWGVYYIREKANENYVAGNFNVAVENVVLTSANGTSSKEYKELISYVRNHDLSVQEHYDYVCSQVDIAEYMDYIIAQMYIGNTDNGNIKFFKTPEHKWTWVLYDTDFSLREAGYNAVKDHLNPEGTGHANGISNVLIRSLLENAQFKDAFIRQMAWQFNNIWTEASVFGRIAEFEEMIGHDMKKDCARWNLSYSGWQSNVEDIRSFVRRRNINFPGYVQRQFGLSTAQMREYGFPV